MWATSFAARDLTTAEGKRIGALVKQAVGEDATRRRLDTASNDLEALTGSRPPQVRRVRAPPRVHHRLKAERLSDGLPAP